MGITIRKHRRNLSYDDAATLDELWAIAKQFDRSFYREWKDHWDERGYDEYIVVTEGRLPYCVPHGNPQGNPGGPGTLHRETEGAVSAPCALRS